VPSNGAPIQADEPEDDEDHEELEDIVAAPRNPKATPFGSVWDSQLGTAAPAASSGTFKPIADDEDFDEPEIPEYLIAEQRRGTANRGSGGGGARGGRAAYQSAIARERYGRGGGGGINRYPDVSGRTPAAGSRQDRSYDRGPRPSGGSGGGAGASAPAPRRGNDEWSEVPPELEAQLMAQIASKPVASRPADVATEPETAEAPKPKATRKPAASRTTTKAAASDDAEAPKPKTTRKPAASKAAKAAADPATETADAAPKKRTTTRKPATASAAGSDDGAATDAPAKKPRAPRKAPTA